MSNKRPAISKKSRKTRTPSARSTFRSDACLAALTVIMLSLAYPTQDLSGLAWCALVPWMWILSASEGRSARTAVLWSLVIGFAFFLINIHWLRLVTVPGWVALCVSLGTYWMLFGWGARRIFVTLPRLAFLLVPSWWVAVEFLRSTLLSGFPWLLLGHTQYRYLEVIQIADILGVYGISFLIAIANCTIVEGIAGWRETSRSTRKARETTQGGKRDAPAGNRIRRLLTWPVLLPAGVTALLLISSLAYGNFRLSASSSQDTIEDGPLIVCIQGNIPQSLKMNSVNAGEMYMRYRDLTEKIVTKPVDLVVWPETMVPGILNQDEELRDDLSQLARDIKSPMLIGAVSASTSLEGMPSQGKDIKKYNSAYLISADGEFAEERYDKIHLVPFGEYIPLRRFFPFLAYLMPYDPGFFAGEQLTVFSLATGTGSPETRSRGVRFGVVICYEDTLPYLARRFAQNDVDFLINITNDGWFQDTNELEEHLAIAVFRAVEIRRPIIRAANTGISSCIAASGEIISKLVSEDGKQREIEGALPVRPPLPAAQVDSAFGQPTIYVTIGDCFALVCLTVSVALIGVTFALRKKRR